MPALAAYPSDHTESPDHGLHDDSEIRLSAQEQTLIEAGVRFLNPLSRWIWHYWAAKRPMPPAGDLSEPLPLGTAYIARAALKALAFAVNDRLDAPNLGDAEEHHLMNDLGAVESAEENLARSLRSLTPHLPFSLRRISG